MDSLIYRRLLILGILTVTIIQAQFYFGRNKVQYESFTWETLSSDHFDIYYQNGSKEIAGAAASFAEDAFKEYEETFHYTPEKKIPLVIYNNPIFFQQTNILSSRIPEGVGGFFEFIKGRVVLPYRGRMWEFYHVVRHELVHVFMNHKINHHLKKAKVWDRPPVPLWFSEGLAEWWSIGWDSQAEMILRDAVLFDNLVPLNRAGGFIVYKEGQAFFRYFENRFNPETIITLLETYWEYDSFPEAISKITGVGYRELMLDWEQSLKKEFAGHLAQEESPPLKETTLTRGRISTSPSTYQDEDGQLHVVYLSNRGGYTNIYDSNVQSDESEIAVKGERTSDLESLHLLQTGISANENGEIAFSTLRKGRDALVIRDIETQKEITALHHKDLVTIRSPQWGKNGETIVFSATDLSGREDLYLWETERDRLIRLTQDFYSDRDPAIHPNGDWIVFSSDRGTGKIRPAMGIYMMEVKTGTIQRLINDEFENTKPVWDRNNPSVIHFISTRSGTRNIWSIEIDKDKNNNKIEEIVQESNYHTGVLEMVSINSDSSFATLFNNFGFRIHPISLKPRTPVSLNQGESVGWALPKLDPKKQNSKIIPYRLKYTFDLAQTMVAYDPYFGILGGGQVSVSDILGNRYYHFLLANSAQTATDFLKRFNLAVTAVDLTRRVNRAFGGFYFANDYFDPYQAFFFEQSYGIRAGANLPISSFQRIEVGVSLWRSIKDFQDRKTAAVLGSNTVSWVHDNTLWSPIGPIDGWRARITLSPIFDYARGRLHNYTILGDMRIYYRPVSKLTLAHRTTFLTNDGKDIRRHYIGGSWGLRGYSFTEIFGRKYILVNNEIRFPFARALYLDGDALNFGIGPIQGALFLDAGNAWERDFPGVIGSLGIGLRASFGGTVLRWDYGKRTDFKTIQKSWFSQFFFGWDF